MGARCSTESIKDRFEQACKRPWMRLRGVPDERLPRPQRLEITVTRTITQQTSPLICPDNDSDAYVRARSPSLLTINSAAGLSPSGSPAGVALGIPAEHILDESPSGFDGPVPPLTFSSPPMAPNAEVDATPSTPVSTKQNESGDGSNPFEGSPVSGSKSAGSTGIPAVEPSGSQPQTTATPRAKVPAAVDGDDPDAITPAPPLDQKPCASEHAADISRIASDYSTCYLCGLTYRALDRSMLVAREYKAYLPCGHFFGNRCLFRWVFNARNSGGHGRCPQDCISLRHDCGHLTTPVAAEPTPTHRDASAAVIPWACEFCETPEGSRLRRNLEWLREMERATEKSARQNRGEQKGGLQKAFDTLCGRHAPFAEKIHSVVKEKRQKAETKLHRAQAFWWIRTWERFWEIGAVVQRE
ncbi:hypothetical protein V8C37DRAFT_374463 [Trichoderma ceciliae]